MHLVQVLMIGSLHLISKLDGMKWAYSVPKDGLDGCRATTNFEEK